MFDNSGEIFKKLALIKQLGVADECASEAYIHLVNVLEIGLNYGMKILAEFRSRMSFGETIPEVDTFQRNLMKLKALLKEENVGTGTPMVR